MARFRNTTTQVVINVDDSKASRFTDGYEALDAPAKAAPTGHAALKVDELRAEIERRNQGRNEADLLPTEGKKADLVAILDADDASAE